MNGALKAYRVAWAVRNDGRLESRTRLATWARKEIEEAVKYVNTHGKTNITRTVTSGLDGEARLCPRDASRVVRIAANIACTNVISTGNALMIRDMRANLIKRSIFSKFKFRAPGESRP